MVLIMVTVTPAIAHLLQATDKEGLKNDVRAFLKINADKEFIISTAEWLGLFEEDPIPAKVLPSRLALAP